MILRLLCLSFMCCLSFGMASEITLETKASGNVVTVKGIKWPMEQLKKDLKSGLSTTVLVQIVATQDSKVFQNQEVQLKSIYDLWDENYHWTWSLKAAQSTQIYSNEEEVIQNLNNLRIPIPLFSLSDFAPGKEILVKARVILNPVGPEKLQKIKVWIAENNVAPSLGAARKIFTDPKGPKNSLNNQAVVPLGSDGRSRNPIFDKIFSEFWKSQSVSGAWEQVIESKPLKINGPSL